MGKPISSQPISLLLILLLPLTKCSDLIDQTCKRTPNYSLCESSLRSDPQSPDADTAGLATIMANLVLRNATETLNYIEELIKQSTDQQTEQALAYCAELYIPVVKYSVPEAIEALRNGEFEFANDGLSDAGKEADGCQAKLSASNKSLLGERNQLVRDLSAVAVSIVNLLIKG